MYGLSSFLLYKSKSHFYIREEPHLSTRPSKSWQNLVLHRSCFKRELLFPSSSSSPSSCPPPILPLTPLSLPLVHPPPLQQPLPQLHPSSNISSFSLEPPSHHHLHVSGHQVSREQLLKSNRSPPLPGLPPPPPSANPHSSQLSSHLVLRLSSVSNCPPPTPPLHHLPSSQPGWSCHLLAPPRPPN